MRTGAGSAPIRSAAAASSDQAGAAFFAARPRSGSSGRTLDGYCFRGRRAASARDRPLARRQPFRSWKASHRRLSARFDRPAICPLAGNRPAKSCAMLSPMAARCLLVDDSTDFLEAASKLLVAQGLAVAGVASTSAEALARVRELEPDVAIVDVDLNDESGIDLAWRLASTSDGPTRTILTSARSEADLAEVVAVTPVLGFTPKDELSGDL